MKETKVQGDVVVFMVVVTSDSFRVPRPPQCWVSPLRDKCQNYQVLSDFLGTWLGLELCHLLDFS